MVNTLCWLRSYSCWKFGSYCQNHILKTIS
jgi:hypothetical protein